MAGSASPTSRAWSGPGSAQAPRDGCSSKPARPPHGARGLGLAALLALGLVAGGCAPWLARRDEPPPELGERALRPAPSFAQRRTGSLWRDQSREGFLFADVRARHPGDLLTVLVREEDSGSKEAKTGTDNETEVFGNLEQFFGLPQQLAAKNPDVDVTQLVKAKAARKWDGEGSTTRKGRLLARVTVEVKAVSPTGNLWVEGDKVVTLNNEAEKVAVSGWVRPEDLSARNEVESTRLASARIEYFGVGPVGRQQRAGWGLFLLDWLWPF